MLLHVLLYKTGVISNDPASVVDYNPHCFTDGNAIAKEFTEVFIKKVGANWVEQSGYSAGAIPVLKVHNVCDGFYDYIGGASPADWQAALCCVFTFGGDE